MDKEQEKALKSLERAFLKCKKVGIYFYGMDEDLHAIAKDKADESLQTKEEFGTAIDHLHISLNKEGVLVNTHGSYRNSGGF